ncbi:hypothetical protein evm_010885 [Chilo suppressalis]|nr:hypothetical protein evm_010885 [Chilo suppressalis]
MKSSEILLCSCLLSVLSSLAQSYVLLQVSKDGQNRSNVDALIHKVLPSDQYDKIAAKIARKQLLSAYNTQEPQPIFKSRDVPKEAKLVAKTNELSGERNNGSIVKSLKELFDAKPVLRTDSFQIAPKVIDFRSNNASLLYEVSSDTLVQALKDILSSNTAAHYADEIARRAAAIYKVIKNHK